MANPAWGAKRICANCGSPFYDLNRDPIICPKCGTEYDPEAILRSRRTRAPIAEEKEVEPVAADEEAEGEAKPDADEAEEADELEEEEPEAEAGEEEEDEELIEDASELGEDEDDMAEVIDNIDEEEDR